VRKAAILGFLSRDNPVNVFLGACGTRSGGAPSTGERHSFVSHSDGAPSWARPGARPTAVSPESTRGVAALSRSGR
jgi:hypothetical protein